MAQLVSAIAANAALKTSTRGKGAIASFEGVVLKAYPDPGTGGKPWTIGIGHTALAGPPTVVPGMVITRERAFAILADDLVIFENAVKAAVKVPVSQGEFDALVSLCLNIGGKNFAGSSVVRRLNAGDRAGAADAFLMWVKANGHVLGGLVTRRKAERETFLANAYVTGSATAHANDNAAVAIGVLLKRGCAFPDAVRSLQTDLAALGYRIGVDGDFGSETEKAVLAFQGSHALTADGKVGPATRSAIAAALKAIGKGPVIALHPLPGDAITAIAA
ncbi:hypothetical protein BA190_27635 [Labrys sp. WJW]|uniref:glycoside hydrolase family protein n=1 Tax=Labrys sp. WJW TaxID=1737983 RepID=UPI000831DC87|nr:glycoside hydrolase family protein [Labrys sp. WJW]OCC01736.1 hypothetical protein BA190_27635 [Labrys sp. WJW]